MNDEFINFYIPIFVTLGEFNSRVTLEGIGNIQVERL
jgi:hypothetical protein